MHGIGKKWAWNTRGGTATRILTLAAVIGLLSSMGGTGGARAQEDGIEVPLAEADLLSEFNNSDGVLGRATNPHAASSWGPFRRLTSPRGWGEIKEFDELAVFIEIDGTDEDAGIKGLLEGEPWGRALIFGPDARLIYRLAPRLADVGSATGHPRRSSSTSSTSCPTTGAGGRRGHPAPRRPRWHQRLEQGGRRGPRPL